MKRLTLLFSILLAGVSALASVTLELVPAKGKVSFLATGKPSFLKIRGEAAGPSGTLTANDQLVSGSLQFDLSLLKTGIDLRDEHMKKKYLEIEKSPDFKSATLTLSNMKLPSALGVKKDVAFTDVPFSGQLKLHGVTQEVSGTASYTGKTDGASLKAKFSLKLSKFGVDIPSYSGITVSEDVSVEVESPVTLKDGKA